jgi:hypothetical protein
MLLGLRGPWGTHDRQPSSLNLGRGAAQQTHVGETVPANVGFENKIAIDQPH